MKTGTESKGIFSNSLPVMSASNILGIICLKNAQRLYSNLLDSKTPQDILLSYFDI